MNEVIQRLQLHRINNVTDLCRLERRIIPFAHDPDVNDALRNAWFNYVNSNNLLSELRNLTRTYPFSSECLDEAKGLALIEMSTSQSWNYCWLTLKEIEKSDLISKHALRQAQQPEMWGGAEPSNEMVNQLSNAFIDEWKTAVQHMLRHWKSLPVLP